MPAPTVFISYSHKDEEWKDRLVTHLGVLEMADILDLWEDRRIEAGDDWKPEIEEAINKATVAILMISANFLTSKFILDEELPKFLERRSKDGLRQSGDQIYIPCGLLARAEFYRITGALDKSQKDLDEAFSIAARGGMGLHLADCHLEYARLFLAHGSKGDPTGRPYEDARQHLTTAKEMIAKMGYHRRDKEVEELEEQLK